MIPRNITIFVFLLHGTGEGGDDLDDACRHQNMKHVRVSCRDYQFVFIAHKCLKGEYLE